MTPLLVESRQQIGSSEFKPRRNTNLDRVEIGICLEVDRAGCLTTGTLVAPGAELKVIPRSNTFNTVRLQVIPNLK